jgi:hypothetical protein
VPTATAHTTKHHHVSAKRTRAIRRQLRRELRHPKRIHWRAFIKKASLVDFTLPITIRLNSPTNDVGGVRPSNDTAQINLGQSLGTRIIKLDGTLPAEIQFHDSYDGGALGNVDLSLPPSRRTLKTSTIPLLTNPDVSSKLQGAGGCSDFTGVTAGVDDITYANSLAFLVTADNPFNLGPGPFSPDVTANASDVVLRTAPLSLGVATPGDTTWHDEIVGTSGGQANLFGNIPGKSYGVDVTVSLVTDIHTILREVDGDDFPAPPGSIGNLLDCRQFWTGKVPNLVKTKLTGNLRISPAIDADGSLRIAKVSLQSPAPTHLALQACIWPYGTFATDLSGNLGPQSSSPYLDPSLYSYPAPDVDCNTAGGPLDQPPFNVGPAPAASVANGFTTTATGAVVQLSGDLTIPTLTAEVLIGDAN